MGESREILLLTFLALCLGALVGLERQVAQRERVEEKDFPGLRTFAFLALTGALSVLAGREIGAWMSGALFLATTTFLVLRYHHVLEHRGDPGYTTEMAGLCTFAIGALAQSGQILVASAITIGMVALLRSKRALHHLANLLSPIDMETLVRFLVITGIIFPLLPDESIHPAVDVLHPRDIWRMVVLISGVSFVGYVLMRVPGGRSRHLVNGFLGGLISGTAATLSYARTSCDLENSRPLELQLIIAAAMTFIRMMMVITVVQASLLPMIAPPLLVMFFVGTFLGFARHYSYDILPRASEIRNPLQMMTALKFASVYMLVLVLVDFVRDLLGDSAIYSVSAFAGLAGADAPSLSLARLARNAELTPEVAAFGIVLAAIATTIGKTIIVATAARGRFVYRTASSLLLIAASGATALFFFAR